MKAAIVMVVGLMVPVFSGCMEFEMDCNTTQDMSGQKVVCNGTSFKYVLQGSQDLNTDQYTWQSKRDTAYVAAVFQGSGTVYLTIKDANGKQVYSKAHSGAGQTAGSSQTDPGEQGPWTVKIETRGLQGQVVVHVRGTQFSP